MSNTDAIRSLLTQFLDESWMKCATRPRRRAGCLHLFFREAFAAGSGDRPNLASMMSAV
jgi:hypothetical protein